MYSIWKTSSNKFKKHSISKIVLSFHCSNKLFQKKSWSLEYFFLMVGQNNFGNKIQFDQSFFRKLLFEIPFWSTFLNVFPKFRD
jgi:hypothetical protein